MFVDLDHVLSSMTAHCNRYRFSFEPVKCVGKYVVNPVIFPNGYYFQTEYFLFSRFKLELTIVKTHKCIIIKQ